jgi:Zn ribbon nucleic-acid-binding protein
MKTEITRREFVAGAACVALALHNRILIRRIRHIYGKAE